MFIAILTVTLAGSLCALDLALTLAVIRRLRQHTAALSRLQSANGSYAPPDSMILPAGLPFDDFTTTLEDGQPLSGEELSGRTIFGFFSPGCEACSDRIPDFITYAGAIAGQGDQALAVIVGPRTDAGTYADQLRSVARLVIEPPGGPVSTAFAVAGFPAFCLVGSDRTVVASGYNLDTFPALSST